MAFATYPRHLVSYLSRRVCWRAGLSGGRGLGKKENGLKKREKTKDRKSRALPGPPFSASRAASEVDKQPRTSNAGVLCVVRF